VITDLLWFCFWQSCWKSMCLKRRLCYNPEEGFGCCGLFMGPLRWCAFCETTLCCSSSL